MYTYGLGLISQEEKTAEGSNNYRVFHYDYRGSTTALTKSNGTITDRIAYDPYGTIIEKTGNTETVFLYVGSEGVQTASNGLYYMRGRYYNPETQQFINVDPIKDGLNWYAYVEGNPINAIDPLGLNSYYRYQRSRNNPNIPRVITAEQWNSAVNDLKGFFAQTGRNLANFGSGALDGANDTVQSVIYFMTYPEDSVMDFMDALSTDFKRTINNPSTFLPDLGNSFVHVLDSIPFSPSGYYKAYKQGGFYGAGYKTGGDAMGLGVAYSGGQAVKAAGGLLSGAKAKASAAIGKAKNFVKNSTGSTGKGADFYVTPQGDAIPGTKAGLNRNLSMMQESTYGANVKYTGTNSADVPMRVRPEGIHPPTSVATHLKNPYHEVPHIHFEYKQNIFTGDFGKGLGNNHILPQSRFK